MPASAALLTHASGLRNPPLPGHPGYLPDRRPAVAPGPEPGWSVHPLGVSRNRRRRRNGPSTTCPVPGGSPPARAPRECASPRHRPSPAADQCSVPHTLPRRQTPQSRDQPVTARSANQDRRRDVTQTHLPAPALSVRSPEPRGRCHRHRHRRRRRARLSAVQSPSLSDHLLLLCCCGCRGTLTDLLCQLCDLT